jgi:hypothetical protein
MVGDVVGGLGGWTAASGLDVGFPNLQIPYGSSIPSGEAPLFFGTFKRPVASVVYAAGDLVCGWL